MPYSDSNLYERALELIPDLSFESKAAACLEMERPEWIEQEDYERLKSAAMRIVQGEQSRYETHALRRALTQIAADGPLQDSNF